MNTLSSAGKTRGVFVRLARPARRFVAAILGLALFAAHSPAQIRPTPGGGTGGGIIGGGGIGITPPIVLPPGIGIGGGVTPTVDPSISAPSGALAGVPASASVNLGSISADSSTVANATYQWSITGGRFTSESRSSSVTFVADSAGLVTLAVTVGAGGTSFSPTASITILAPDVAGKVTTTPAVAANATSVTAAVPPAQNNDRTFRWSVSGGATIVSGQNANTMTFRPGSPGLKEIVCNVNFRNVVTVPVRAYVTALGTGDAIAVTVNGGSGGGTYPAGSQVHLLAHPPGPDEVFDRWTGDTTVLGSNPQAATLSRAIFTVPASPVTLTATYRPAAPWEPVVVPQFNPQTQAGTTPSAATTVASRLLYHVPPDARGLVFLLHPTGGSAADWFDRPNHFLFLRNLVAAGYGIAALNSVNRTAGTWAAPAALATNLDALNHAAALDLLIERGLITPATPVFFSGQAAGANAALRYADLLATATPPRPIRGAVLFLTAGLETLAATSKVPQFFALAANDDTLGTTGLQDARAYHQILLGRGVATALSTNGLFPLYAGRFRKFSLKSPTFTADGAEAIWTALRSAGIIDANLLPASLPSTAALNAALPPAYRPWAREVAAEIAIAAADHEFFSDASSQVLAFLGQRVDGVPAAPAGRLVNLSTRGSVAYLGDTLAVGFTLTGTQNANVLVRALGPGLARFRVESPLAATRLELYRDNTLVAANQGWDSSGNASRAPLNTAAAAVGAFTLANNSLDSALLLSLAPGTYTARLTGIGGAVGEAMAEIYDVSRNQTRLTNLSTLARINRDGDAVIPGIVVAGENPRTLVLRAVSQGLLQFGLGSDLILSDPRLTLYRGNQVVATNNSWSQGSGATLTAAFPVVGAFPLTSANDAALLNPLEPGSYTLQASATPLTAGNASANLTGSVLVEVYELP